MLVELHYLPSIEYFCLISKYGNVKIEVCENYQKQTYRNRCKILTTNKIDELIIPVQNKNNNSILKDIKIDYQQDWTRRHWGAILSAYGKAPFFEYFADYFNDAFIKKHCFLFDMNLELLTICLKILKMNISVNFTENFEKTAKNDFRNVIHPKISYQSNDIYCPFVYSQNFGNGFVPNLSIIDLLMNHGNLSAQIISSSIKNEHSCV